MTAIKRTSTDFNPLEGSSPNKAIKLDDGQYHMSGIVEQDPRDARITELERQIKDLHAFIEREDMVLKAPPSIRKELEIGAGAGAAESLAQYITRGIVNAYSDLEDDLYDSSISGITSDNLSYAMVPFLPEIERLSKMDLKLSFSTLLELGDYSYGEMDNKGCGYGDRPSDTPADEMLLRISMAIRETEPDWQPVEEFTNLASTGKLLDEYGIETYFTKSIEWVRSWLSLPSFDGESRGHNIRELTNDVLHDDSM